MGNTVSPCLLKNSSHGISRYCSFATSSVRGSRTTMEDAHICKMMLTSEYGFFAIMDGHGGDFVANTVAKRMSSVLVAKVENSTSSRKSKMRDSPYKTPSKRGSKAVLKTPRSVKKQTPASARRTPKKTGGGASPRTGKKTNKKFKLNLSSDLEIQKTFMQLDLKIQGRIPPDDVSGCTFIGVLIPYPNRNAIQKSAKTPNGKVYSSIDSEFTPLPKMSAISLQEELELAELSNHQTKKEKRNHSQGTGGGTSSNVICMNVGDSRSIMLRDTKLIPLSIDHKPDSETESARIKGAGCRVFKQRVEGMLAVSRAFGDYEFKKNRRISEYKQAVVCTPDITREAVRFSTSKKIDDAFSFIVLACDGIWDVMRNEEVIAFIRERSMRYDLFNDEFVVPKSVTFPYEANNAPWHYSRVKDWTIEHVQAWKATIEEPLRNVFQNYHHLNGADLMKAVKLSKRSKKNQRKRKNAQKPLPTLPPELIKRILYTDDTIKHFLKRHQPNTISTKLRLIAEQLIDECVVIRGSLDNCSVTIVVLHDLGP